MTFSTHIILALGLLFVVRALPMLTFARRFAPSDVLAHSFMVEYGRISKKRLLEAGKQYPVFFHLLVSFIPLNRKFIGALLPFLSDAAVLLVMSWILNDYVATGDIDKRAAIITLYLFVFYPASTGQFFGTRNYGLNERVFVEAVFSVTVLLLIFMPSISTILIATGLLAFLLVSSKFSIQAIFLVLLPAGMILLSPCILAALSASLMIVFIVPVFHFGQKLRKQAAHLIRYVDFLKEPGNWAGSRNKLPRYHKDESRKHYLFRWARFIGRDNAITVGLIGHGLLLVTTAIVFLDSPLPASPLNDAFKLVLTGIAVWLLTSFGIFKILGEAERYLNYVMAPGFILVAYALSKIDLSSIQISALFILLFLFWLVWMIYLWKISNKHQNQRKKISRLVQNAKISERPGKIVSLTSIYECWLLLEFFGERFWWFEQFFYADWQAMFRYPYLKIESITSDKYACLIADEDSLAALENEEPRYGEIRKWPVLAKMDGLYAYKIPASNAS